MQIHLFSDLEGIRIAAEIERRGGDFYRRAARISRADEARSVLSALASDEETHLREFQRLYEREAANAQSVAYDPETSAYLSAIAADIVFSDGLIGLSKSDGLESPRAILEHSIQSEKDSILFYVEMTEATRDEHTKTVFKDIIRQEKMHLARLQRMLSELD